MLGILSRIIRQLPFLMPMINIGIVFLLKYVDSYEEIASTLIVYNSLGAIVYSLSFRLSIFALTDILDNDLFNALRKDIVIIISPILVIYSYFSGKHILPFFIIPLMASPDVYVQFKILKKTLLIQLIYCAVLICSVFIFSFVLIYCFAVIIYSLILFEKSEHPILSAINILIQSKSTRVVSLEYFINQLSTQGEIILLSGGLNAHFLADWILFKKLIKLPNSYFLSKQLEYVKKQQNDISTKTVCFLLINSLFFWFLLFRNNYQTLGLSLLPIFIYYNTVVTYPYFLRTRDTNILVIKIIYILTLTLVLLSVDSSPLLLYMPLALEIFVAVYSLKKTREHEIYNDPSSSR